MAKWEAKLKAVFRADLDGDPIPLGIVCEQITAMEIELSAIKTSRNMSAIVSSLTARPTPGPVELPAIPLGSE